VAALLDGLSFGALLGDKAYDADWLRRDLLQRGAEAVIPPSAFGKLYWAFLRFDEEWT
jgi:hypothetical protein